MSLRILFADDSMTAQNMGKKILSEAGYDVVAVSNGAAAVKKIAEQKPDIIILDVYMPGYSGLEVCEKVRGSLDTLKTPVLLTVGKMEPYKPEDANRVKADGVIIKPFEASDLLAIVKKFEERIGQAAKPVPEQTVLLDRKYVDEPEAPEPSSNHHATGKTGVQPMVEVPDHMASTAAFGDLLGGDSSTSTSTSVEHFAVNTPAAAFETSVIVPAPPMPVVENEIPASVQETQTPASVIEPAIPETPVPEIVVPETVVPETVVAEAPVVEKSSPPTEPIAPYVEPAIEPEIVVTPVEPEPAVMAVTPEPELEIETAPEPTHPPFIPAFKDVEPAPASFEILPTSAPPIPDLEIPREPALQETADITTRSTVADRVEPGLMSTIEQQVQAFPLSREAEPTIVSEPAVIPEPAVASAPAASVASAPADTVQQPAIEATPDVSDADFEARVAAALAAYSHASESAPAPVAMAEEAPEPAQLAVDLPAAMHAPQTPVTEISAAPVAEARAMPQAKPVPAQMPAPPPTPPPSFEYHSPVSAPAPEVAAHTPMIAAPEPPVERVASSVDETESQAAHEALTAGLESALPVAVAAAAETGAEHHTIAQAVHRVMERIKPELVEEILRELKTKK